MELYVVGAMPSGVASWFSERGSARGSGLARRATTCHRRLLSLHGRVSSLPLGDRSPLPALVFHVMSVSPNSLSAVCNALCVSLQITTPTRFGVGPGCSVCRVREWFALFVVPPLDRTLHDRLSSAAASLAVDHVDLGSQQVNCGAHPVVYGRSSSSSHARHWGLSLSGVTIPFLVVALLDIWAHRCLVPFAVQPQVICSIALLIVLPSTTFGWSGATRDCRFLGSTPMALQP